MVEALLFEEGQDLPVAIVRLSCGITSCNSGWKRDIKQMLEVWEFINNLGNMVHSLF